MDKAAIFADLTRRNALRKANGLSPLDILAEYVRQVAVARQRDYRAASEEHAMEREGIRQQVLAELRAMHGANFGVTMGGRWAINTLTQTRFAALMAPLCGMRPEHAGAPKNTIVYGEGRKNLT
jgi:hypothetical protein